MSHSSLKDALEAAGFNMLEPDSERSTPLDRPKELAPVEHDQALQKLRQHQPGRLLLEPGLFRSISPSGFSIFRVYHHRAGYPLLQWWGRDGIGLPIQGADLQRHLIDIDQVIKDRGFDAVPRAAFWVNAQIATTKAGKPCLRQYQPNSKSPRSILANISLPAPETFAGDCQVVKTLRQSAMDAEYDMDTIHLVLARPGFRVMWGEDQVSNFRDLLEGKWGFASLPT